MNLLIKYILVINCLFFTNSTFAELDSISTILEDEPFFKRKNNYSKVRKKRNSNTPSFASVLRLKSQSKRAKNTISRTNRNHFHNKKSLRKKQKKQIRFTKNKNYHKIKKNNFDKKRLGKQKKRIRNLDNGKTKH